MNHDELVEKMLAAYWGSDQFAVEARRSKDRMSAALRVAVEEMLGEPDFIEIQMHDKVNGGYRPLHWPDINWYLAYRRQSLLNPKSAEERVEVRRVPGSGIGVFRDGLLALPQFFLATEDAETFRLGLIQQLKEAPNA